jgi:hypothetical protein
MIRLTNPLNVKATRLKQPKLKQALARQIKHHNRTSAAIKTQGKFDNTETAIGAVRNNVDKFNLAKLPIPLMTR